MLDGHWSRSRCSTMGITAEYLRVPAATLAALRRHPRIVERYLFPEPGAAGEKHLDLDGVMYSLPKESLDAIRALPLPRQRKALLWLRRRGFLVPVSTTGRMRPRVALPPRPRTRPMNIDKAWHGVHYLLCGRAKAVKGPLGTITLGGHRIGKSLGYGPCRYLKVQEVRAASTALSRAGVRALRARFAPLLMQRTKVYPGTWEDADLEYLIAAIKSLRAYFARAAARGEAMLVYWL